MEVLIKMTCSHLVEMLRAERKDLRAEIEKDKWYLSEREGHDVGWKVAERHFIENYLDSWAEGYKKCYCRNVCRESCTSRDN
jgi:hypothetical protein